jgi:hypothetical protein
MNIENKLSLGGVDFFLHIDHVTFECRRSLDNRFHFLANFSYCVLTGVSTLTSLYCFSCRRRFVHLVRRNYVNEDRNWNPSQDTAEQKFRKMKNFVCESGAAKNAAYIILITM